MPASDPNPIAPRAPRRAIRIVASSMLCALLAASGQTQPITRPRWLQPTHSRWYQIKAADLAGVTRLRLEQNAFAPPTSFHPRAASVHLGDASDDVWLLVASPGKGKPHKADPAAPGAWPRLTASREGDLLVLRWYGPASTFGASTGVSGIALPTQFTQLAVERAFIQVQSPMPWLQVSGSLITVGGEIGGAWGEIGELDLRSSWCPGPCPMQAMAASAARSQVCTRPTRDPNNAPRLSVSDSAISVLRITAAAGRVELDDLHTRRLELHLADSVTLWVGDMALLDPGRVDVRNDFSAQPAVICAPVFATAPAPGALALELLPDKRPKRQQSWPSR